MASCPNRAPGFARPRTASARRVPRPSRALVTSRPAAWGLSRWRRGVTPSLSVRVQPPAARALFVLPVYHQPGVSLPRGYCVDGETLGGEISCAAHPLATNDVTVCVWRDSFRRSSHYESFGTCGLRVVLSIPAHSIHGRVGQHHASSSAGATCSPCTDELLRAVDVKKGRPRRRADSPVWSTVAVVASAVAPGWLR